MDALHETRRDYQPTRLSFYGVPPVGCSTRRPPQPGWCRATNCGRRTCASPAAGVRTDVAPTLALEKRGDVHGRTLSMERMCMTADRTRTNFGECAAAVRGLSSAARGGHSRERRGYRSTLRKGEQADRTARGEIVIVSSIGLLWNDVPGRLKEGGPPRTRRGTPSAAVGWGGCGWRTAAHRRPRGLHRTRRKGATCRAWAPNSLASALDWYGSLPVGGFRPLCLNPPKPYPIDPIWAGGLKSRVRCGHSKAPMDGMA
jgi:hypothetical protein